MIPVLTSSELTFPCALEEKAHNENLQTRHGDHEPYFHHGEVEYPILCAFHRAKVAVLAGPEILLVPADGAQLCRQLQD